MKTVLVFDGTDEHLVDLEYFFQDPLIANSRPEEVCQLYTNTRVFEHTESIVIDNKLKGWADLIGRHGSVVKAREILQGMIMDIYGELKGSVIIGSAEEVIKQNITLISVKEEWND